jgi:hypothetical protein
MRNTELDDHYRSVNFMIGMCLGIASHERKIWGFHSGESSDCGLVVVTLTLKMKAAGSSEILVTTYKFAWCHNPEDHNLVSRHTFSLISVLLKVEYNLITDSF